MLRPRVLRTLEPLSAASGLAVAGRWLYVVADDREELGAFPRAQAGPARLVSGLARAEPSDDPVERKARKADLEALVALPGGELLALGSGATAARHRGVHWPAPELAAVAARPVDLGLLHLELAAAVPDLNLEGAAIRGEQVVLAQRGNGPAGVNALAVCALTPIMDAVRAGVPVPAAALLEVLPVDGLGAAADGTALTLTDLTALPDGRLLATAVAETGASTYDDGACVGAAVAVLSAGGAVERVLGFDTPRKVEGIVAAPRGDGTVDLVLCVDPDDPAAVATLLGVTLRL